MGQMLLSYLILYGLKNNIVCSGSGSLLFQREKMYASFRYISALFLMLGIAITSFASYFLQKYVYAQFELELIGTTVMVLIVGLYNFLVSFIWTKLSGFKNYLYQSSYSYIMDFAYTLSILFTLNLNVEIKEFAMMIAAILIVVFFMSIIMGFFVETFNKSYVNSNLRHVPSRLFLLAIFSILIYYAGLMV